MSHLHVQQFGLVEQELNAVRKAIGSALGHPEEPNYAHLVRAARNLETTYITRLFSQFESILRSYMRTEHPRRHVLRDARPLINRVALLLRMPNAVRDGAQNVREFRNSVVHADGTATAAITFQQSSRNLNKFLALLP